ncbi:hypothetical protein ACHAXT_003012 [Thalassiosira profunda]
MAGDSSVATSGTKKKKKNVFKSLGKGLSYKKKKSRPDDETVVGVAVATAAPAAPVAPRSVGFSDRPGAGRGPSTATAPKPIQVVLLLMDPSSRRFELLQLEFDTNKALVSDVLRQIKGSATEKTLRDMNYAGVCDSSGMEMIASMKLSRFCEGNDVVMAMPSGMTGKQTAKLATPILGDPKVEDMLAPCGVKVETKQKRSRSGTKLTKIDEEKKTRQRARSRGGDAQKGGKTSSPTPPTAILAIIVSSLLFFTIQRHVRVTKPLESGSVLLPGQWKSQCGIFDLFPEEWVAKLPLDKLSSSCDTASSSMLELGRDGTLRYFRKGGGGELQEAWSAVGGGQCTEGAEGDCVDQGAKFVKDGGYWYVDMGGFKTSLNRDVIRDFTAQN